MVVVALPPKKAVLLTERTVVEAKPKVPVPTTVRLPSVAILVLMVLAAWTKLVTRRTERTTESVIAKGPPFSKKPLNLCNAFFIVNVQINN